MEQMYKDLPKAIQKRLQRLTASLNTCQVDLKTLQDESSYDILWKFSKYFLAKRK